MKLRNMTFNLFLILIVVFNDIFQVLSPPINIIVLYYIFFNNNWSLVLSVYNTYSQKNK